MTSALHARQRIADDARRTAIDGARQMDGCSSSTRALVGAASAGDMHSAAILLSGTGDIDGSVSPVCACL